MVCGTFVETLYLYLIILKAGFFNPMSNYQVRRFNEK